MRKLFFTLALCSLAVTGAMAQDTEAPVKKYSVATNSFWANWFVSAGLDYNAAYTSEGSGAALNPFSSKRGTFGFTVAVGKWFTPSIGMRTKFNGLWSKQYISKASHKTYKYFNVHEDIMFNLSNMLFGYNEARVWNFIPYVGLGFIRDMSYNNNDISYHAGLLNNFRLSDHWDIFFEVYATMAEGSLDGAAGDLWKYYEERQCRHWDKIYGLEVGITYNLGKCTWERTPDVAAIRAMYEENIASLESALKDAQAENARLKKMLEECQNRPPKTVEKVVDNTAIVGSASVFFNVSSSRIASKKDLVNVQSMVDYAKANGKTITVTGYADSKTGSAEYNQTLSEKRAQAVANEIIAMGMDSDKVVVKGAGGVDSLSPYTYNRRAVVEIK